MFIILQQNIDTVKVESDMDALSEVDPIDMNSDEVYFPPEFSIIKAESEVSLVSRSFSLLWLFIHVCMCSYVHLCVLHVRYYVIQNNCLETYCFVGCDVI
jgi:hypothetical protein